MKKLIQFVKNCFKKNCCFCNILICVFILIVVCRIAYDINVYIRGTTLVIRYESKSGYDYLLRLPPRYNTFSGKRPLIIYLHGAGEVGKDVTELKDKELWFWSRGYATPDVFPFIVVSPMTEKYGWDPKRLKVLIDELTIQNTNRFQIDRSQVYLTGYSMGAFGTFETACQFPDLFAAIASVAGGGRVQEASKLQQLPIWAFHGDADPVVDYSASKEMIDAVIKTGNPEAKLTTYVGYDHGIASHVYQRQDLYKWFLVHRKHEE